MHRHEKRKQLEEAITAVECRKAVLRQRQLKERAEFEEDVGREAYVGDSQEPSPSTAAEHKLRWISSRTE